MIPRYRFEQTAMAAELIERFAHLEAGEESGEIVAVAGRVMLLRVQGKLAFGTLRDSSAEIQLFALAAITENFNEFIKLNLGDWLGARGEVVRTKRGELSVKVASYERLAETRHGFGDKWHGVSDPDIRYRQREVDLWANPESRSRLMARSAVVRSLRERLWALGFVEVETPVLNAIPGGAAARPFVTHHNALDADFYLRIATELHLKRLVVGGFE
ncbi:MAG: OB-fold nucleic acid binding domain-containing protein, partial [Actinobacteria bacterium]|nr:OB-fold nucleic acid binding domain-containing protein [Actinomycetota bacterium]